MRRFLQIMFVGFCIGLPTVAFMPSSGIAQTAAPATAPAAQQTQQEQFIQDLGNKAIGIVADKSLTQEQRTEQYRVLLHDAFDLKTIGRFVIGRAWNTATPAQQQEYMKLFEDLVVRIYGDRLNFYSGETFRVTGARPESAEDTVVHSEIDHPDGTKPTTVDWRVRQSSGKNAIIDVMIEGVSQSVTQRQEYSAIIQRDGGKIDGLLELMRQRVQGTATATPNPN